MPQSRINSASFFLIYFATTAIYVYVNRYLPVLFFVVLNIDRVKLAFMQLISYSALFAKPLFAILSDNYAINNRKRKPYIVISCITLIIGFFLIILNITELLAFSVFLATCFLASSFLDVSAKGMIIESSPTVESKNRKIFITKIGASFGAIFPNLMFLVFMHDMHSIQSWYLFLSFSSCFLIPLVIIIPFMKEPTLEAKQARKLENETDAHQLEQESEAISQNAFKLSLIAMCAFIFLLYADKLLEFPLEPWIIEKFGENSFYAFSLFMIFGIFINIVGYVLGTYFLKRFNRKVVIAILTIGCGLFEIMFAFVNFLSFLILMAIVQVFAGIISINLVSLMMEFAKNNKVLYYQIIAAFVTLSIVVFIPLGTLLSEYVSTELIFIISGVLLLASLIPLTQVKINKIKK